MAHGISTLSITKKERFSLKFAKTEPGTLVLIENYLTSLLQRRLRKIESLHPAPDVATRLTTVGTVQGCLQRPLIKLCPLFHCHFCFSV